MFAKVKSTVERFPAVATTYRAVRDALRASMTNRRAPAVTPWGFRLLGEPSMEAGTFEPEETKFLLEALKRANVFIDVGANIGFYTCLARAMNAHCIAIEPLRSNLDFLSRNILVNGWHDVEVFPVGVGSRPDLVALYGASTGASVIESWAGASKLYVRTVPLSTLDIVVGDRFAGRNVLVKIDVEGFECDVLHGARKLLTAVPAPTWLVEVCFSESHPSGMNPRFREVFELFWANGYVATTIDEQPRAVTASDVDSWLGDNRRGFGSHNYVFHKPSD